MPKSDTLLCQVCNAPLKLVKKSSDGTEEWKCRDNRRGHTHLKKKNGTVKYL